MGEEKNSLHLVETTFHFKKRLAQRVNNIHFEEERSFEKYVRVNDVSLTLQAQALYESAVFLWKGTLDRFPYSHYYLTKDQHRQFIIVVDETHRKLITLYLLNFRLPPSIETIFVKQTLQKLFREQKKWNKFRSKKAPILEQKRRRILVAEKKVNEATRILTKLKDKMQKEQQAFDAARGNMDRIARIICLSPDFKEEFGANFKK